MTYLLFDLTSVHQTEPIRWKHLQARLLPAPSPQNQNASQKTNRKGDTKKAESKSMCVCVCLFCLAKNVGESRRPSPHTLARTHAHTLTHTHTHLQQPRRASCLSVCLSVPVVASCCLPATFSGTAHRLPKCSLSLSLPLHLRVNFVPRANHLSSTTAGKALMHYKWRPGTSVFRTPSFYY